MQELIICHFNDAYHIEPAAKDPVGGAARYRGLLKTLKNPFITFGGDAFNPSLSTHQIVYSNYSSEHCHKRKTYA
jgi:hypothetical protein